MLGCGVSKRLEATVGEILRGHLCEEEVEGELTALEPRGFMDRLIEIQLQPSDLPSLPLTQFV